MKNGSQPYQTSILLVLHSSNYPTTAATKFVVTTCKICNTIKAIIGEKSNPPIGGMSLLKMSKYKSVTSLIDFIGCCCQLILGIHVKNILNIIIK